jgi:effector-binding domain-containing protein
MLSEPKLESRDAIAYVAIARNVHMNDVPEILPPLIAEVKQWMLERGVQSTGPDFFFYKSMSESGELECEVGFPVGQAVAADGIVVAGVFPAGTYASIIYTGDFKDMMQGYKALETWIGQQKLTEKVNIDGDLTKWGGRRESYLVDPEVEPNPDKWQTEISFLLQD